MLSKYPKIFLMSGLLLFLWVSPALSKVYFQCPTGPGGSFTDNNGDGIIRADEGEIINPVSPRQVCMHLGSGDGFVNMADGRLQYMFGFSNLTAYQDDMALHAGMLAGRFPAPPIRLKEGDEFYLSLTNAGMMMRPDLFDPHTVHWHGFPNASAIFDGVPDASISINMGSTLTYYYKVVEPGTFMYHCHVEATEHMQMGMLGNLYVEPVQDGTTFNGYTRFAYNDGDGTTGYDVVKEIQIHGFDPRFHDASLTVQPLPFANMDDTYPMLNGRGYPDTVNPGIINNSFDGKPSQQDNALVIAEQGQRILLRISSLSTTSFHTLTINGIPMQVVGRGSQKLVNGNYYTTNSITLGGGQSVDVILDTQNIPPGTYYLYTTNLDHLNNEAEEYGGMMTEIRIN